MPIKILDASNGTLPKEKIIPILSAEQVQYKATGYLVKYVGVFFGAEEPVFLPLEHPIWQVTVTFQMYDVGPFTLGVLDIDGKTGEIIPLTDNEIDNILARADAYVDHYTPDTETAS